MFWEEKTTVDESNKILKKVVATVCERLFKTRMECIVNGFITLLDINCEQLSSKKFG